MTPKPTKRRQSKTPSKRQTKQQAEMEPLSGENYAAELRSTISNRTRTLAIAPGLTHDEAVAFVEKYRGTDEVLTGFVKYT